MKTRYLFDPYSAPRDGNANDNDMLAAIQDFAVQLRGAWSLAEIWRSDLPAVADLDEVIITGMGGSAIGGDLVAGLAGPDVPVPITVHRSYGMPSRVGERTLVIASSYSGNTEETLSSWKAAHKAGAHTVAITTGGELADLARKSKTDLLLFEYPAEPRGALGYSFALILGVLSRIGLVSDGIGDLPDAVEAIRHAARDWDPEVDIQGNLAKQLADHCRGGVPAIFAAEHLAPVARRWTTQINENAKNWATWAEFPELNHNLVVGLAHPARRIEPEVGDGRGEDGASHMRVVNLRSAYYHRRIHQRQAITAELLDDTNTSRAEVVPPIAWDRLTELLWTTWLGDYVSYYLAQANGVDPTPVEVIHQLKRRLKEFV